MPFRRPSFVPVSPLVIPRNRRLNDVERGSSFLANNQDFHAFLYSAGTMVDLNKALPSNSGWQL